MVSHVSTVAEARAVVESCRCPPQGHRSASDSAPALGYASRSQGEINSHLNEQTLLIAMLETPEAIENADAIAAVDGTDMLHIGSCDLSTEMGVPNQHKHARMRQAYEATARAARSHGKSIGVGGVREDFEFQTWLIQLGMRYLTGGSDVGYILGAGSLVPVAPT
jgi:2-keto-3-deoxy-L-rhamnonate aldolase RhmA